MVHEKIKIIRSQRRRKTVSARLIEDTILIYAPAKMPEAQLEKIINNFQARFRKRELRKELNKKKDLVGVAQRLNKEYFAGRLDLNSIEYSTNQTKKFGCCNYRTKKILISHTLTQMPEWVRDYVIIHEMAHLIEPNHSHRFWNIVLRYKLTERARGFLIAKGFPYEVTNDKEKNTIIPEEIE